MRVSALGASGSDRDGLLLMCRAEVNYTTNLTINRNLGTVGQDGFTQQDCDNLHGTVDPDTMICISSFIAGQLDEFSGLPGEMYIVPFGGLNGFPVEITQEKALPCGDEGGAGGMSTAIALTTQHSQGTILNANDVPDDTLTFDTVGEPFSCDNFSMEDGPGILTFAAPQLGLPILGDGVTQFRFADK